MGFNDIPVLIIAKPANDILVGHLGAQTASGRLVPVDAVCEDTSASAFLATQPLDKTCYGRFWRYAKIGQIFFAQKAFVAAMQASHMHHKFNGLHDQSSSVSRVTAGAAGFLILTQQSLRPGRYGDPSRFDTMPSQPRAQAYRGYAKETFDRALSATRKRHAHRLANETATNVRNEGQIGVRNDDKEQTEHQK